MFEEGGLPPLYIMASIAFLVLELLFVWVTVTGLGVACCKGYPLELIVLVAFGAWNIDMLVDKGIFGLVMVDLDLFPALCRVAILALRFPLMRVLVTGDALFKLVKFKPVIFVALRTLDICVLPGKRIFGVSVMLELLHVLPSGKGVALAAILVQLALVCVFMAGEAVC